MKLNSGGVFQPLLFKVNKINRVVNAHSTFTKRKKTVRVN